MKHWDNRMQAEHQQAPSCGRLDSRCPGEIMGANVERSKVNQQEADYAVKNLKGKARMLKEDNEI